MGSSNSSPSIAGNYSIVTHVRLRTKRSPAPTFLFQTNRKMKAIALPNLNLRVKKPTVGTAPHHLVAKRLAAVLRRGNLSNGVGRIIIAVSIPKKGRLTTQAFGPGLKVVNKVSVVKASNVMHPFSGSTFLTSVQGRTRITGTVKYSHLIVGSKTGDRHFLGNCLSRQLSRRLPPRVFIRCKGFVKGALGVTTRLRFSRIIVKVVVNGTIGLTRKTLSARDGGIIVGGTFLGRLTTGTNYGPRSMRGVSSLALTERL